MAYNIKRLFFDSEFFLSVLLLKILILCINLFSNINPESVGKISTIIENGYF